MQSFSGPSPEGTHDHILLSQVRDFPKTGGRGPRIYISQEQGDLVIAPGTGFPFHRLLRLARLRWRYSTPSPHGILCSAPSLSLMLQPTVSRPVCLEMKHPSRNYDQIFIVVRQMWVC
jgi:hypothetical protein